MEGFIFSLSLSLSLETLEPSLCLSSIISILIRGFVSSLLLPLFHFWFFMALISVLLEILQRPSIGDVLAELVMFSGPLWIAVIVGLVIGWAWKPKWANLGRQELDGSMSPPSFLPGSISEGSFGFASIPSLSSFKPQLPSCISWISNDGEEKGTFSAPPTVNHDCRCVEILDFFCG